MMHAAAAQSMRSAAPSAAFTAANEWRHGRRPRLTKPVGRSVIEDYPVA